MAETNPLREKLYVFQKDMSEEDQAKMVSICGDLKSRLQCFYVDSDKSDKAVVAKIEKQVNKIQFFNCNSRFPK